MQQKLSNYLKILKKGELRKSVTITAKLTKNKIKIKKLLKNEAKFTKLRKKF